MASDPELSLLKDLEANVDMSLIREWLKQCTEGNARHKKCVKRKPEAKSLPTRLIDVGEPKQWPCIAKLMDTTSPLNDNPSDVLYITLSHSWGTLSESEQMSMITTVDNIEDRKAGIDIQSLPSQYQAVIVLCRCLEIRYLWVDSLCILQGEGGDWPAESVRMAQIYGFALLTICTNSTQNLLASLQKDRHPDLAELGHTLLPVYENVRRREPTLWLAAFWKHLLEGGPIGDRAWCLQERHLSPRVLHLLDGGVMAYECTSSARSMAPRETFSFVTQPDHARMLSREYPRDLLPRLVDLHFGNAGAYDYLRFWYSIFTDYQKRQIKYRTDNLAALQGVAELMSQSGTYTYLSGIWLEDLARGLLWARNNAGQWEVDADPVRKRQAWTRFPHYQGPTWSWCSVHGSTRMHDIEKGLAHVHEVSMLQKTAGPGRLKNRFPLFSGVEVNAVRPLGGVTPLQNGSYIQLDGLLGKFRYVCGAWDNTGHLEAHPDAPWHYYRDIGSVIFDIPSEWRNRDIWCLAIASPPGSSMNPGQQEYLGLALEPIGVDSQQHLPGTVAQADAFLSFRRLGLALLRVLRDWTLKFDDDKTRILQHLRMVGFQDRKRIRLY